MRILLASILVLAAACHHDKPAPVTPPTNAGGDTGTPSTQSCEDGMTIWDATANECRLWPGGPYGHAGCSERTTEAPGTCFTGSSWDGHCDCACDTGAWDDTAHACK